MTCMPHGGESRHDCLGHLWVLSALPAKHIQSICARNGLSLLQRSHMRHTVIVVFVIISTMVRVLTMNKAMRWSHLWMVRMMRFWVMRLVLQSIVKKVVFLAIIHQVFWKHLSQDGHGCLIPVIPRKWNSITWEELRLKNTLPSKLFEVLTFQSFSRLYCHH